VLYIEDNPANLTLVKQILRRRPNIQLISAPQGTLGLELAFAHKPDLILLDIRLPDISGVEVFNRLRARTRRRRSPWWRSAPPPCPRDPGRAGGRHLQVPDQALDVPLFLETVDLLLGQSRQQ